MILTWVITESTDYRSLHHLVLLSFDCHYSRYEILFSLFLFILLKSSQVSNFRILNNRGQVLMAIELRITIRLLYFLNIIHLGWRKSATWTIFSYRLISELFIRLFALLILLKTCLILSSCILIISFINFKELAL